MGKHTICVKLASFNPETAILGTLYLSFPVSPTPNLFYLDNFVVYSIIVMSNRAHLGSFPDDGVSSDGMHYI
jgi:hypothetical protein